ncbi:MAG: ribonuclease III [Myxococcales bacterium]|nr:ribonuclease III [Myxococcales bacterium]
MDAKLEALIASLGHSFRDPQLVEVALTHRSGAFESKHNRRSRHLAHNERLEFLGDAVLALTVAELLFLRFPEAPEGELTRLRAALVNEATLAAVATRLGVGPALRLGRGEDRSGGRLKPSLLADALEALFAAVYLDAGVEAAKTVIVRLLGPVVDTLSISSIPSLDAKTRAQEIVQARFNLTPTYEVVGFVGPDHDRVWSVTMIVGETKLAEGRGRTKKAAEQDAARSGMTRLEAGWAPNTQEPGRTSEV